MTYRGLVYSNFRTVSDFATAIGWSRNKASRIVNGIQEPDAEDMVRMAELFGICTPEKFMEIFFAPLSTKWTTSRDKAG